MNRKMVVSMTEDELRAIRMELLKVNLGMRHFFLAAAHLLLLGKRTEELENVYQRITARAMLIRKDTVQHG